MLRYDTSMGIAKIRCEVCAHSLDGEMNIDKRAAMSRAVHMAKLQHWSVERAAGTWQHFCPACRTSREKGKLL